jgi:hypothetical protein
MLLLYPSLALLFIFLFFLWRLYKKNGSNLFGEIGVIYLGLFLAYTIIPAIGFYASTFSENDVLGNLLPSTEELSKHLWRHVLFGFAIAAGYLINRGNLQLSNIQIKIPYVKSSIIFLITFTFLCIIYITINSGKVTDYYDNFSRFDHLSWFGKKVASLILRMKYGLYAVLITFLLIRKKNIYLSLLIVSTICFYEITYSLGARIISLMIILQAVALYNFTNKKISIKKGLVALLFLGLFFSLLEKFRESEFSLSDTKSTISSDGIKAASEFGSVYFPGYHLYLERSNNRLPVTEWPMFFNDIISIFTFGDFDRYNPMGWYTKNFYPEKTVAPFTIGPIAESAIWGGEIDLFFRGFINGLFFAFLVKWFIRNQYKWWVLVIYTYCYATCIMTMKYSVFYQLTPIVRNILPIIILIKIVHYVLNKIQKRKISLTY